MAPAPLPPYVDPVTVSERLPRVFPEGTPNRTYCTRGLAASTVFAMLYIGAVEGSDRWLSPKHVYRMSAEQAGRWADEERERYREEALKQGFQPPGEPWYADNTREPIRDETLREGLVALGAAVVREGLPTTSSKPRYALQEDFARLFDPSLDGESLEEAIGAWQASHLTPEIRTHLAILREGAAGREDTVTVTFPNGEARAMEPGPSSVLSRAVVEEFAPRFLERPAVLWLSESKNKVVAQDQRLAEAIGLPIEPDRNLPDLILADLGPSEPLVVFVEVVVTDGAVTARRQEALYELTRQAGLRPDRIAFVTAYEDRQAPGFRKTLANLAWGSFAWFHSEPGRILVMRRNEPETAYLSDLL